ncbi:hypothetical protein Rhal01_02756 [Rubritalea halochordaticola]|uniref:ABC transporter permease n=1 Tax=Rubritalea halochordaticola TaxID=714537 RepID=A0ABP9V1K4_9BACT
MAGKTTSFISLRRITTISSHTFTQLVRMKVFYLLSVFAVLLIGVQMVEMPYSVSGVSNMNQDLRLLKSAGFFAMNTFAFILALSATALLLPKDIEDRTLYTILCKPVPRLDYLLGKLGGVLCLILVSLLVMDGLFSAILHFKVEGIVAETQSMLGARGLSAAVIERQSEEIYSQGVTWNLQIGVLAVFLKAAVIASIAMLVSTFSTSTIFTIIITVIVALIGTIQADAREYFMRQEDLGIITPMSEVTRWVALLFPDFQLLGVEDGVIDGKQVPSTILGRVCWVAFLYCAVYTVLSWFVFRRKEV